MSKCHYTVSLVDENTGITSSIIINILPTLNRLKDRSKLTINIIEQDGFKIQKEKGHIKVENRVKGRGITSLIFDDRDTINLVRLLLQFELENIFDAQNVPSVINNNKK